jgi:uncharacterized protein (TIGR02147 family)
MELVMSVFAFESYKSFVNAEVEKLPKKGRGEFQRLAHALQMHTTSVSQIFRGEKDLTLEQAAKLCAHWGLNGDASDYFVTLVEFARAESPSLKKILRDRLQKHKDRSQQLAQRIPKDHVLTDSDKYRFYSEWHFSAIRLLSEISSRSDARSIADHLGLPLATVQSTIEFLIELNLVVMKGGKLGIGPSRTYLEASSPLIVRHHTNWRLKAVEKYPTMKIDTDLAVTAPMTISAKDAAQVREILLTALEKILAINSASPAEQLRVLNIDWLFI